MTGVKLQHYLLESGIFTVENVFMVEILDGVIHNRVPTYYKCKIGYNSINISLYRKKFGNDLLIGFSKISSASQKLTSTHKLNELTLSTLVKELDKYLRLYQISDI